MCPDGKLVVPAPALAAVEGRRAEGREVGDTAEGGSREEWAEDTRQM